MSISANELRIGNWVSGTENSIKYPMPLKVIQISDNEIRCAFPNVDYDLNYNSSQIYPIPLAPEILEKCGFANRSQTSDYYFIHPSDIIIGGYRRTLFPSYYGESGLEPIGVELKYLHQLQNLYFCLTGNELTIDI